MNGGEIGDEQFRFEQRGEGLSKRVSGHVTKVGR